MNDKTPGSIHIHVVAITLLVVLFFGCSHRERTSGRKNIEIEQVAKKESKVTGRPSEDAIEQPPFSDDIFPCTACHADLEPNPTQRVLVDMHDDISAIFDHDRENRWCLDCHDLKNRDSLKLASGKLLDFKESYKLCGQCHGDKLRDWKVGVHGKRTGYWNGPKKYLLCVNCHNPHKPKFQELTPEPPPVRQEEIR